jgi:hypothetical protein
LRSTVKEQNITIEGLQSSFKEQNITIEGLQSTVKEQNITIERQNITIKRLDSTGQEQCIRLSAVESRDNPITVREAMRVLETHICLDAAGSKSRYYKYYNIARISQSKESKAQEDLTRVLTALNLTEEHLNMLAYLKDNGDIYTHYRRPMLSKAEWISMLTVDDDACSECAQELIKALEHYIPCPSDGKPWNITDPMNKEKGLLLTKNEK